MQFPGDQTEQMHLGRHNAGHDASSIKVFAAAPADAALTARLFGREAGQEAFQLKGTILRVAFTSSLAVASAQGLASERVPPSVTRSRLSHRSSPWPPRACRARAAIKSMIRAQNIRHQASVPPMSDWSEAPRRRFLPYPG